MAKKEKPKATVVVTFRTSDREYKAYEASAKREKKTVSAWVRAELERGKK